MIRITRLARSLVRVPRKRSLYKTIVSENKAYGRGPYPMEISKHLMGPITSLRRYLKVFPRSDHVWSKSTERNEGSRNGDSDQKRKGAIFHLFAQNIKLRIS